tara:strand:+ start:280 stop:1410 length:1131 start_codon:yes stop_codon:yes gene_type:complete
MNTGDRPINMQRTARGFSLVEVLIAILVLAIGMLGLGAIFPAIIAEQRDSFEAIEGEQVAEVAEALISSNREFIDFSLISQDFNKKNANANERYAYEWVVPQDGVAYYGWDSPIPGYQRDGGFLTGLWSFNGNSSTINPTLTLANTFPNPRLTQIPVSARVYPAPYSGKDPKYVWDLALRREPAGDRLQAAIFVRRIDTRLRIPSGYSLSDALTGGNGYPDNALLPVAINAGNGRITVDNGEATSVYAAIQVLETEVHEAHLDWLVFTDGRNPNIDTSVGFAAKVGQKLLDNTGVVRTVVGLPTIDPGDPLSGERVVQVDPPFTLQNAGGADSATRVAGNSDQIDWDDERASWVRQVIFTPRTPVGIRLVTLEESP